MIILCLNIDALSFGISNGLKNAKINLKNIILISIFSTALFIAPFLLSKYIYSIFNRNICNYINGILLITLGIIYLIKKENNNKISKNYFYDTIVISIDALFTALFCGYQYTNYLLYFSFYFLTNFLAIFLGNRIFYKFSNKFNFNFSILSGLLFFALGTLKIFGI